MLTKTTTVRTFFGAVLPGSFRDMDAIAIDSALAAQVHRELLLLAELCRCQNQHRYRAPCVFDFNRVTALPAFTGSPSSSSGDTALSALLHMDPAELSQGLPGIPNIDNDARMAHGAKVRVLTSGPEHSSSSFAEECFELFEGAERHIVINHQYFHPTNKLLASLQRAVRRGVRLTIITNGEHSTCPNSIKVFGPYTSHACKRLLVGLTPQERLRVKIHKYVQRKKATHKKVIVRR